MFTFNSLFKSFGKTLVLILVIFGFIQTASAAWNRDQYDTVVIQPGHTMTKISKTFVNNPNEYLKDTIILERKVHGKWRVIPKSKYNLIYPGDRALVLRSVRSDLPVGKVAETTQSLAKPDLTNSSASSNSNLISNSVSEVNYQGANPIVNSNNQNSNTTKDLHADTIDLNIDNYRFAILILSLLLLTALTLLVVYAVFPIITQQWEKNAVKIIKVKEVENLKKLADYLSREVQKNFEFDPQIADQESHRTFDISVVSSKLQINVRGYEQSTIHEFLQKTLIGLNLTAISTGLKVGPNDLYHYSSEWEIMSQEAFAIPEEDLSTLIAKRKYMQRYGEWLAVELLSLYKLRTHVVSYQIDPPSGIMNILFKPDENAIEYYGSKETPKEYESHAKLVMLEVAEKHQDDLYLGQFSFVEYRRDKETLVSTITIKLHLVEEIKNVKSISSS